MESNLVAKGNVDITGTTDSFGNKLIRFFNHPITKGVGKGLLAFGTLFTGYKITDNIIKNDYDGSMDLLGLVSINLTKYDKS